MLFLDLQNSQFSADGWRKPTNNFCQSLSADCLPRCAKSKAKKWKYRQLVKVLVAATPTSIPAWVLIACGIMCGRSNFPVPVGNA